MLIPKKTTQPTNYYYFKNGFTDDEITKILNNLDNIPFKEGALGEKLVTNKDMRSSKIKWIPKTDDWLWLYNKLINYISQANDALWNFDIISINDNIQLSEYTDTDGSHYNWHQDIGNGTLSFRKISITVQLSDTNDYEGGDFQIMRNALDIINTPRDKGS
jgi:PKHD-type hydroxylase